MKMIVAAVDGSPRAEGVISTAVSLAKLNGAKICLVRSFGIPPAMPAHVWALPDGSLIETLRHDAQTYLDARAKDVPPELLAGVRVEIGVPWEAVCHAAKAVDADLVIIGAHGYAGIDHLLGTTAAKIANHIDRPLMIVRPKPPAAA
jgi:universal stress protein F